MTPTYHRSTLNKTPLFESKRFQAKIVVFQNKTRRRRTIHGVVDTTTVHHQSSKSLASVCQLRKSSCQNTNSFKRKRMWTALSSPSSAACVSAADDDLAARVRPLECQDMIFDSFLCDSSVFAMKTSCPPCDLPSGQMVHPASVYVTIKRE